MLAQNWPEPTRASEHWASARWVEAGWTLVVSQLGRPAGLKQAVAVDLDGQLLQLRWHLAAGGAEVAGDEDGDWRRFVTGQLVGLKLTSDGDPQVADLHY